jgi:hypothetical protein
VQETKTRTVEFVIEKSKRPIQIGIILLIENCSKGDKKNIKKKDNEKNIKVKMITGGLDIRKLFS